jgi:hypothetical protein
MYKSYLQKGAEESPEPGFISNSDLIEQGEEKVEVLPAIKLQHLESVDKNIPA